jgi:hypothetical protein
MRVIYPVRLASVAAALLIAGFTTFPSFPSAFAGLSASPPAIMVNRALKGDRLRLLEPSARPRELGLPVSPGQSKPREKIPMGCDAAFSPVAAPTRANVFGRCMV